MRYSLDEYRLQVTLDSKECTIPEQIRADLQDWLDKLGRQVGEFASSELTLTVVYHPKSDVFHSQGKLKLPGRTMTTGDYAKSIESGLQRTLDKLIRHAEKYRLHPDGAAADQAQERRELEDGVMGGVDADADRLTKAVEDGDYLAFRNALLGQEEFVQLRVGRWVQRYPEIDQEIGRGILIGDIAEEVFLSAFEKHGEKPRHLSMREWLETLIDPAVKAIYYDPEEREAASFARSALEAQG